MHINLRNQIAPYFFILFAVLVFSSCESNKNKKSSGAALPSAQGDHGEILLLMDSASWQGRLGDSIRSIFTSRIPGLPQPEPRFKLTHVKPRQFTSTLKRAQNLIFVTVLNDNSKDSRRLRGYFTPSSLKRIQSDTSLFMFTSEDEYAKGQKVMHLFARDEEVLINRLHENKQSIIDHWQTIEEKRIRQDLFRRTQEKLENQIKDSFGIETNIPYGYEIAIVKEDFIWLRLLDADIDRSIYIYYRPYTDKDVFKLEKLMQLRNRIGKKYIYGSDAQDSYMTTETLIMPSRKEVNFNGSYAVRLRGLWKLNDNTMGGPFISYTTVDESQNRLYYIEGFVYAPGERKRDPMIEMKVILESFELASK